MSRGKKKYSGTKSENQTRHFRSRLIQRYGIYATEEDISRSVASIGSGAAEFYYKDSSRVSIYFIMIQGHRVLAAFDRTRKTFCTALPMPSDSEIKRVMGGSDGIINNEVNSSKRSNNILSGGND